VVLVSKGGKEKMNRQVKRILLAVSILALLVGVGVLALVVSARNTQSQDAVDAAGAPEAGPTPGAPIESRPTPTPAGSVGDAEQPIIEEASQGDQAAPSAEEPVSDVEPEHVLSGEELDAILDGVNLAPPLPPGRDEEVGEGPEPGTESGTGP